LTFEHLWLFLHDAHTEIRQMPSMYLSLVAPNAEALANLAPDYGLTWPQDIRVDMGATKSGNNWVPVVNSFTCEYSRQARILAHQTDLTAVSIPGLINAGNFQAAIDALDQLGVPGGTHNFYSLAAVASHESQHSVRCREAIDNLKDRMVQLITAVTVPVTAAADAGAAVTAIRARHAFRSAVRTAVREWNREFDRLIDLDHDANGPCEIAERRVVTPLIAQIRQYAISQRWIATPAPVALPAGALGVAAATARVGAPAPAVPAGVPAPVVLPAGVVGVAARAAALQPPLPLPIPAPGPPPQIELPGHVRRAQWPPPKS
jgi:hypothetical protein